MKYVISLILIFTCTDIYAQAVAQIRSHNQLTATGTVSHTTLDSFYNSKAQPNGLASLDANGNLVQTAGTVTGKIADNNGSGTGTRLTTVSIISGTATLSAATIAGVSAPYIAQTNGTATGIQLTSVQINSGTATLSGIESPYIAQTNGTATKLRVGTSTYHTELTVNGDISIQSSGYLNFNPGAGTASAGYGIRDSGTGTIQYKNNAGTWTDIPSGVSGGGFIDNGTNITEITVTDQVIIGSTTAASNQILTVVGSQTTTDLNVRNAMSLAFTGTPTIDLAIGDNDTGIEQSADNIIALVAGGASTLVLNGTTSRVRIGTSTSNTTLQVGGTVTAEGFSGNGAGLTDISTAFSAVTGLPITNPNIKIEATATSTVPLRSSTGDLFATGIIGGTTTGALRLPVGNTSQRPNNLQTALLRWNTQPNIGDSTGGTISYVATSTGFGLEIYTGTEWKDIINDDLTGTYTVNTFTSSGNFVVTGGTRTVEVLVIAGGGGGGGNDGGGGGAGGATYTASYVCSGTVTVVVGAGGAGAGTGAGSDGSNSSFGTITATGGGGGGGGATAGRTGGSGGGGGNNSSVGSGTAGQGYAGGAGINSGTSPGGGGGGKGGVGQDAPNNSTGGNGGAGIDYILFGTTTTYAGGGGGSGGTGGAGSGTAGGGSGGASNGNSGDANRGGGGGGTGGSGTGGTGGSGIVKVRYVQ